MGRVAARPAAALAPFVGGAAADHLVRLAHGEDARIVEPDLAAKSYGEEGTFAADARDDRSVREAIIGHADAIGRRLRRDRVRSRVVVLKLKLAERLGPGKFRLLTRRATLPEPTDDGKTISDAALRLWERHRPRLPVRLVGVSAAGIVGDAPEQLALFAAGARPPRAAPHPAPDALVARLVPPR